MTDCSESTFLRFDKVQKSYDQKNLVVKDFNLDIPEGEFLTLLGPSGSGKTTVLMMMAGFESVTAGDILLKGEPITRTAPYKRNIGMVFQNYALFPHMSIAENLAYPLKLRKMPKEEIKERVERYLELIELEGMGGRPPAQLSGGQRQRVALARALIFKPSLVLMDEPLGALDKKLRELMQLEISRLHKKLGFTAIYVTHDQTEALTMSDRIAVFNNGVVQQCASPDVLYEQPENSFVADFIGENNFLPGIVESIDKDFLQVKISTDEVITVRRTENCPIKSHCRVSVRPEKLFILPDDDDSYLNSITAKLTLRQYVGDYIRYFFQLPDATEVVVKVLNDHEAPNISKGGHARLGAQQTDCFAFAGE